MRKTSRDGGFWLVYLFNIILNFRLTIPGWILLVLHFIIPEYIRWWYCLVWFGAFLLYILIWMLVIRGIARWANTAKPAPPIQNRNPYSSQGYVPIKEQMQNKNPYSSKGYVPMKDQLAEKQIDPSANTSDET